VVRLAFDGYSDTPTHQLWVFSLASDELKADRAFVRELMSTNSKVIQNASAALRDDREVVLAAVEQDGAAYNHASDHHKADVDVALAAVKSPTTTGTSGAPPRPSQSHPTGQLCSRSCRGAEAP
jgi:hypothetical protein